MREREGCGGKLETYIYMRIYLHSQAVKKKTKTKFHSQLNPSQARGRAHAREQRDVVLDGVVDALVAVADGPPVGKRGHAGGAQGERDEPEDEQEDVEGQHGPVVVALPGVAAELDDEVVDAGYERGDGLVVGFSLFG